MDFNYGKQGKGKTIPDIIDNNGRLFLNPNAYDALHKILKSSGEFLPVYHKDEEGYIFNPLLSAEAMDGIDKSLTTHDQYGNLTNFGFLEDKVKHATLFKTELDSYLGIFCSEEFKKMVEENELCGITFGFDIGNPIGNSHGLTH